MTSILPEIPGSGRSRFSKMLPMPPAMTVPERSPASISTSAHSPLPPLPKDAMPPLISIPRRPVGMTAEQMALSNALAKASGSPLYSGNPALSRSTSDSSSAMKDSPSVGDSDPVTTPPIPPKDVQRNQSATTPKQRSKLSSPISLQSSPQQPEIWRRRSVKSDRSIVLPDLKLNKSNGSTASPPRQEAPEGQLPQLPRSQTGQRKPVPARPAPPQPEFMGNKLSKLKEKDLQSKLNSSSKDEAGSPRYPADRPPTPEYLKADGKLPELPQVVSPISPDTPPEELAPCIPVRSDSRNALASHLAAPLRAENRLSTPDVDITHSRQSSGALTITSPQPLPPNISRVLIPQPLPSDEKTTPLILPSPAARLSIYFPTVPTPAAEGTIFLGMPLDTIHLECYQSHKFMRGSRNTLCPVACMVCQGKDLGTRWRCTWCCLSACGSCMQVLSSIPGKDLRLCLERIRA